MKFEIWISRLPWLVLGAALAVRLAYFTQFAGTPFYAIPMWDADEYHTLALDLSRGRIHPFLAYRPPLYPLTLGLVYMLVGVGPLIPSLLQIAAGVWSARLAQKIGDRLFGVWAGLGAGLAVALSGMLFYNDLELMPTSLETLLLLLLIWELLQVGAAEAKATPPTPPADSRGGESSSAADSRGGDGLSAADSRGGEPPSLLLLKGGIEGGLSTIGNLHSTIRSWEPPPTPPAISRGGGSSSAADSRGGVWLAGLWFALGALARPVLLPLYPLFAFWIWRRGGGFRPVALFSMTGLAPILLSLVMHFASGAGPSAVAAQGGINFYIGNRRGADGFTATFPGVGAGWNWETVQRMAEAESGRPMNPTEADGYYWKKGIEEIAADPVSWAKLTLRKSLLFWNRLEISNNRDLYYHAERYPVFGAFLWLGLIPALPLALAGAWIYRRRREIWLIVGTIALYYAAVVPFFVNARFRTPLLPLLFILAAGGAAAIARFFRDRRDTTRLEFVGAGAFLIIGLALPWLSDVGIDPKRWDYGYFTEATALERLGRTTEAVDYYNRALEANPRAPFVHFNLGEIRRSQGTLDEAVDLYHKELDIQPAYGTAWQSLGRTLRLLGEEEQADRCLEQAYRLRPDLRDARDGLAAGLARRIRAAMEAGERGEAEALLDRLNAIAPGDPSLRDLRREVFGGDGGGRE